MAVRRVRRVIRKIDPWTVLKVSLIFNAIAGLVFVLGVWVMWSLAIQRGIPDQITEFFANFALVFNAEGELYFRVIVLLTVISVIVLTGLMTLGALIYNLISDLVGGIEIIVLEETYLVTQARQAPLRPAVHVPTTDEVDTVRDESLVQEATEPTTESPEAPEVEPLQAEPGDVELEEEVELEEAETVWKSPVGAEAEVDDPGVDGVDTGDEEDEEAIAAVSDG
ncbi:MAG: DUF3566 domain-containing protein [Acidobacteria bacterium]|nr:DUF3566 domain-containing protein [Acidobacteriota bacterium]